MSQLSRFQLLVSAFAVLTLTACRIIPVQMVRVSQIEHYTQTFQLEPENAKLVFEKLLGKDSWSALDTRWDQLRTQLSITEFVNTIEIRGTTVLTLSIVPSNVDSFTVEGTGRFYVIQREQENTAILFSGDFFIVDDLHSIGELDDGELVLGIRQQQIRHFAESLNYYNDVRVDFRVFIDTSMAKHDVYTVDYATDRHQVELDGQVIGHIEFDEPRPGFRKLIDLRGRQFLRRDYRKKFREAADR